MGMIAHKGQFGLGLECPAMISPAKDAMCLLSPSVMHYGPVYLPNSSGVWLLAFFLGVDWTTVTCWPGKIIFLHHLFCPHLSFEG